MQKIISWIVLTVLLAGVQLYAAPIVPTVSASDGTYPDKVHISLSAETGKGYTQKISRSEFTICGKGCTEVYSGSSTGYDDASVQVNKTYYYFAQTCSPLTGCSALSSSNSGYAHLDIPPTTAINASDGIYTDKVSVDIAAADNASSYKIFRSIKDSLPSTEYTTIISTHYDDTAAEAGTIYYYWVKSCNAAGCSGASSSNSGYAAIAIPPKTSIEASDGTYTDRVRLTITPAEGATSYTIYKNTTSSTPYKPYASVTSTTYDDTAVTAGKTYHYWVKACNSSGCSTQSFSDTGYAAVSIPPSTRIDASDGTYSDKVSLLIDAVSGAASYKIYRSLSIVVPDGALPLVTISATTYDDMTVEPGTSYYYRVQACNSAGCSATSTYNTGYAKVLITIPAVPQNVHASDGTYADRVSIGFDAVEGVENYELYRSTDSNNPGAKIATVDSTVYDDTTALAGVTYLYGLKACNSAGCSATSQYDAGYIQVAQSSELNPPEEVNATMSLFEDKVVLTYSSVVGARSYKIYRSALPAVNEDAYVGTSEAMVWEDMDKQEGMFNYWIKACDDTGCSEFSTLVNGMFKVYELAAEDVHFDIVSTSASYAHKNAINLDIYLSSHADSYRIYRSKGVDELSQSVWIGTISDFNYNNNNPYSLYWSGKAMFYDYSALETGTYYYWIQACNESQHRFSEPKSNEVVLRNGCLEIDTFNKYTEEVENFVDVRISDDVFTGCGRVRYTEARIYRSDTPQFDEAELVQTLPYGTKEWKDYTPILPQDQYYYYWARLCDASNCTEPSVTEFFGNEDIFNGVKADKKAMLIVAEGGTGSQRDGILGGVWDSISWLEEVQHELIPSATQGIIDDINETIDNMIYNFSSMVGTDEIISVNNPLESMLNDASESLEDVVGSQSAEMLRKLGEEFRDEIEKIIPRYPGMPDDCTQLLHTLEANGLPRSADKDMMLDTYGEYWLGQCLSHIAAPFYDKVVLLSDEDASKENFRDTLKSLHNDGYKIDILYDNHGFGKDDSFSLNNKSEEGFGLCFYDIDASNKCQYKSYLTEIFTPKNDEHNKTYNIGTAYSVSCWGSGMNDMWIELGAEEANGAYQTNYFVLISPIIYLYEYTHGGKSSKEAADIAYKTEKDYIFGSGPNMVSFDLRPMFNQMLPIVEKQPYNCGVEINGIWIGLTDSVDKFGNKDYCTGQIATISYDFEKSCPLFFSKIYKSGRDTCRFDLLGDLREEAYWEYDLNLIRIELINSGLGIFYGNDSSKPIDVAASSRRIHSIHSSVQANNRVQQPTRVEMDAQFIHITPRGQTNKFEKK